MDVSTAALSLTSEDVLDNVLNRLSGDEITRVILCGDKSLNTKVMNNVRHFIITLHPVYRSFPPFLAQLPNLRRLVVESPEPVDIPRLAGYTVLLELKNINLEELVLVDSQDIKNFTSSDFVRHLPPTLVKLSLPQTDLDAKSIKELPLSLTELNVRSMEQEKPDEISSLPKSLTHLSVLKWPEIGREANLKVLKVYGTDKGDILLMPRQLEELHIFEGTTLASLPKTVELFPGLLHMKFRCPRSAQLKELPRNLTSLTIVFHPHPDMTASDVASLPRGLKHLQVLSNVNKHPWTSDFIAALPPGLTSFDGWVVNFCGLQLPSSLRILRVWSLSSASDLNHLPTSLTELKIQSVDYDPDSPPLQLSFPPALRILSVKLDAPTVDMLRPFPTSLEDIQLIGLGLTATHWKSLVCKINAPAVRSLSLEDRTAPIHCSESVYIPLAECLEILKTAQPTNSPGTLSNYDLFLHTLKIIPFTAHADTWVTLLPKCLLKLVIHNVIWHDTLLQQLPRTLTALSPLPTVVEFDLLPRRLRKGEPNTLGCDSAEEGS